MDIWLSGDLADADRDNFVICRVSFARSSHYWDTWSHPYNSPILVKKHLAISFTQEIYQKVKSISIFVRDRKGAAD